MGEVANEMIERVARAIVAADGFDPEMQVPMYEIVKTDVGWVGRGTGENHAAWRGQLGRARAAIEAMREPTEDMLDAVGAGSRDYFGGETEELYATMIDAALE